MSLPSLETSSKAIHFSVFSQYMSRENAHLHLLRSLHVDAHSNSVTKQREVNEFFRGVATRCCWRHVLIRKFSIYTKIIPLKKLYLEIILPNDFILVFVLHRMRSERFVVVFPNANRHRSTNRSQTISDKFS